MLFYKTVVFRTVINVILQDGSFRTVINVIFYKTVVCRTVINVIVQDGSL